MRRLFAGLLVCCLTVWVGTVDSGASESSGGKKSVSYTVSEIAYKKLERAHQFLGEEKYDDARRAVDELAERRNLNSHERALVEQTYGYIASAEERYGEAAAAFERCLAFDALPEGAQLNTRYNLAQLYLALEDYDRAIATFRSWFERAENPAPSAYYMLAAAYMQAGKPDQALDPAQRAVGGSEQPKEAWLQLLAALYLERNNYQQARPVLEQLASRFPSKNYWLQLSAVHAELGHEKDALAVMQIAYAGNFLDKDGELRNLARMYLYHEIPYRAARVMEKGLADATVKSDAEAWALLADSWLSAREYDKAVAPLERAAVLSNDGDLYLRLGQLHMERQDFSRACTAIERALAKPELAKRGNALLLLGIARLSADRPKEAREAFDLARRDGEQREAAERWMQHVDRLITQRQGEP